MNNGDVMMICVDNYYFRKIADKAASKLRNYTIISGGNEKMDGQVQIVHWREGDNETRETLCSRHSEIEFATPNTDRSAMSCDELQNLPGGGQVIVANMMSATLMLCYFIDRVTKAFRTHYETFFNCETFAMRSVEVRR